MRLSVLSTLRLTLPLTSPLAATLLVWTAGACSAEVAPASVRPADDAASPAIPDAGYVSVPSADGGPPTSPDSLPSCVAYCDAVLSNCTGANAQYLSLAECHALCTYLAPGKAGDATTDSVACRAYYAGSPARTDPARYCVAAGAFGGGVCGDRCTSYCNLALGICSVDGGTYGYPSLPACMTDCTTFAYRDAGADGGGEGPLGPDGGDTLNCRMHALRGAIAAPARCLGLGVESVLCR